MLFWIITLVLIVSAMGFVLWPLARTPRVGEGVAASDIYAAQLDDIDARIAAGRGDAEGLAGERAEVARRYLRAARQGTQAASAGDRKGLLVAAVMAFVVVPGVGLGMYAFYGADGRPDAPLSAQASKPLEERSLEQMVVMAERRLEEVPDDVRGWTVLANVYGRLGRFEDRERALRRLVALNVRTPDTLADLAEVMARNRANVLDGDAKRLLDEALRAEPGHRKAAFYRAVVSEQEGDWTDAARRWQALAAAEGAPAQFVAIVDARRRAALSRSGAPPGPDAETVAAASQLPAAERRQMIEGMVEGLAARLRDAPEDAAGWQRLVRSYIVLGRLGEAERALADARTAAVGDDGRLAALKPLEAMLEGARTKVRQGEND